MDEACIPELVRNGGDLASLRMAQDAAARALAAAGLPPFPTDACAAMLSALLQMSGVPVPMTLGAGNLAHRLGERLNSHGWDHVAVGGQQPGDIGVTFDKGGNPEADHIYLVVETRGPDRMLIADNQASVPHERFASGDGKTATECFLRATA